jgi:hypothetical protein
VGEVNEEDEPPRARIQSAPPGPRSSQQDQDRDRDRDKPPRRPKRRVDEEEEERITSSRPRRDRLEDEDEQDLPRRRVRRDEDDEERRPRRRRRRSRRSSEFAGLPFSPGVVVLFGLGGVGLLLVILAFAVPAVGMAVWILGALISFVGGIWFLVVAFTVDATQGLLCLCVPFYSLYFLITNWEDTKMPFFVNLIGVFVSMLGAAAGGIGIWGP